MLNGFLNKCAFLTLDDAGDAIAELEHGLVGKALEADEFQAFEHSLGPCSLVRSRFLTKRAAEAALAYCRNFNEKPQAELTISGC